MKPTAGLSTTAKARPKSNSRGRRPSGVAYALRRGFAAGAIGTLNLTGFEFFEHAWLGRPALYAPASIARGLFGSLFGAAIAPTSAMGLGLALRWLYGPSLGAVYAIARPSLLPSSPAAGASLGIAIYLFELVAMPAVGATRALSRWPRHEVGLLAVHTLVFGLATAVAFDRFSPRSA